MLLSEYLAKIEEYLKRPYQWPHVDFHLMEVLKLFQPNHTHPPSVAESITELVRQTEANFTMMHDSQISTRADMKAYHQEVTDMIKKDNAMAAELQECTLELHMANKKMEDHIIMHSAFDSAIDEILKEILAQIESLDTARTTDVLSIRESILDLRSVVQTYNGKIETMHALEGLQRKQEARQNQIVPKATSHTR